MRAEHRDPPLSITDDALRLGQQGPFRTLYRLLKAQLIGRAHLRPVKGGEKPDQRAEQNTASAAVVVRWSEGVGIRLGAMVESGVRMS